MIGICSLEFYRELNLSGKDGSGFQRFDNAFSSAYDNFGDDVESLGVELFYFFSDSPVRREEFEKSKKSSKEKSISFCDMFPVGG